MNGESPRLAAKRFSQYLLARRAGAILKILRRVGERRFGAKRYLQCWLSVWDPLLRPLIRLAGMLLVAVLARDVYRCNARPQVVPPTEIFRGVTYAREEVQQREARGLVHILQVDLAAPGIGLYLTPVDPDAVTRGYQYRLAWAPAVLEREGLAAIVNASLFSIESDVLPRPGDWARGVQTIVAEGQVSHIDPHSYLLWFDECLTPHVEPTKPPTESILRCARWGIGCGAVVLWKGTVRSAVAGHARDRRTAIAVDDSRRLLWLAVFEDASETAVAQTLARLGAQDGFLLDGGHSTTMVLAPQTAHGRPQLVLGGSWPVATFFGIKAERL